MLTFSHYSWKFIMKCLQFKLSYFSIIFLVLQEMNIGLCDSQFHVLRKRSAAKEELYTINQIDLECYSNNSDAISTDIYKNIFIPSGSELAVLSCPTCYKKDGSDTNFIFLNFFKKGIGFTCLPINKRVSDAMNVDYFVAERRKRSSSSKVEYLNKRIVLRCIDHQSKKKIDSFTWVFSNGNTFSLKDAEDYPDDYELGEKTGDLILKNHISETNVTCMPISDGNGFVGNSYQLIKKVLPENPVIEIDGKNVSSIKIGCYTFTCKALGGVPTPKLSLTLNGFHLKSLNNSIITERICLNHTHNGNSLICQGDHVGIDKPWKEEEKIFLNVLFPPVCKVEGIINEPVEGESFTIPFIIASNPKYQHIKWYYSRKCVGEERFNLTEKSRYKSFEPSQVSGSIDRYKTNLTIDPYEEKDSDWSFILEITNSENFTSFCYSLKNSEDASSGKTIAAVTVTVVLILAVLVTAVILLRKKLIRNRNLGYTAGTNEEMQDKIKEDT